MLGLSGRRFSTVGIPRCSETPPRIADVTAQSQRTHGQTGAGDRRAADAWDPIVGGKAP